MSALRALRFSAVVGQDEAKQALLLAACRPALGGVLLRGEKGSAKTTLARGLAALLPGEAGFVELPLGATEDRVIGSLDLTELLTTNDARFRPGLLAAAHGGVLYVDEINLLADHLVDVLLDVAVTGINRVERDGLSHTHPAQFVLVASMNPEEGELRPQLLDRFGLSVDVTAPADVGQRTTAVRRQLDLEAAARPADAFAAGDDDLRHRLAVARTTRVDLPDDVAELASRLALDVGAEGLRADLMLCRAAMATAALDERAEATAADVRAVAAIVLGHRRRRRPFDEPGLGADELDDAWQRASGPPLAPPDGDPSPGSHAHHDAPGQAQVATLGPSPRARGTTAGGFGLAAGERGRFVRDAPFDPRGTASPDPKATAVALAARRAATDAPDAPLAVDDLRAAHRERRTASLVVFVVDASASMGVERRMAATKSAVLGLLGDAYRRRGRVALVTFRGDDAEVVLRPTASVEVARARLAGLRTGGATPLAAGLDRAADVVRGVSDIRVDDCTVVVVTDGRATVGMPDPVAAAQASAERLAATGARLLVIDTETGPARLGLAAELARVAGADHRRLDDATAPALDDVVRQL